MHRDHDVFIQAIEQKKRIKLTFYDGQTQRNITKRCAPLHYSKGQVEGDDLDCYYFWDFEAKRNSNFLALRPSQVVAMEPSEGIFRIEDFNNRRKKKQTDQVEEIPEA